MAAAAAVTQNSSDGLRPLNLATDLAGLAELLEICFGATLDQAGRAVIREMRALSQAGSLALFINRLDGLLGGSQQGFVWVEQGRLVGNATVMRAAVPRRAGRGALIANVAVHPDFRRRGLARSLVSACLDLIRAQRNDFALLQVDATNPGAQALYAQLGFRAERGFTHWVRSSHQRLPQRPFDMPSVSLLAANGWRAEYELAALVPPARSGGLGWLRPLDPSYFHHPLPQSILNGFIGRSDESLVIYRNPERREENGLLAAARLQMQFGASDRLDLLVHPFEQGRLEDPLINFVLRRLEGRRRALVTDHPADDDAASTVFQKYGFEPRQTTINMRIDFRKDRI